MMRLFFQLILLCMVAALEGKYRCDYTYYPGAEGWLKLHKIPANWREARLRCHLEGGILASPSTNALRLAMQNIMPQSFDNKRMVFTGIHSTFSRGDFFSVEGVHLLEIPHTWADNEPDNYKDSESCLAMLNDGKLADVNCNVPYPYICYEKAPAYVQLNSCGTLDNEYSLYTRTGSCYKFHRVPRTWSRAYMACAAEGGYLAIINSQVESTVLKEIFAKNLPADMVGNFWKDVAFVGFHDWGEHGEWLTIDGRTLKDAGFSTFSPGEPNNSTTGEYCGAIYRNGLFDDLWCENHYAFICEKRPDSPLCPNNQY